MDTEKMDNSLRSIAFSQLEFIRSTFRADVLSCYFYNRYSDYFWLFYRSGNLLYPAQMHGPLTHPDQRIRMGVGSFRQDFKIDIFENIPEELSRNVLAGVSFISRERITHCIRIRIGNVTPGEPRGSALPAIVIFLNYRSNSIPYEAKEVKDKVAQAWPLLGATMLALVDQPRIDEADAWRLRSIMLRIHQMFGDVLGSKANQRCQELYDLVANECLKLVAPNKGAHNALCSLTWVNTENQVYQLALKGQSQFQFRVEGPSIAGGIIDYVGQTGQTMLINNIPEYVARQESSVQDPVLPAYRRWSEDSLSELACPLMIQRKVVGVLNLEADKTDAFDDRHVLLLFHYASAAALVVRQATLWWDFETAREHQYDLLDPDSSGEIFDRTGKAVKKLGYSCALWDCAEKRWIHSRESQRIPRSDGFTQWIVDNRCPVVIADLMKNEPSLGQTTPWNGLYKGIINPKTGDFVSWEPLTSGAPTTLNRELLDIMNASSSRPSHDVVTDIGYPIFDIESTGNERVLGRVRAVAWIKCQRLFQSLLDDDIWCLSLILRNASAALKIFEDTKNRLTLLGKPKEFTLEYHFGKKVAEFLMSIPDLSEEILSAKGRSDLIVLNIDVRGSTGLAQRFAARNKPGLYVRLMGMYHSKARNLVISDVNNGVMDKTMGDGIHALFNVYRPDIVPFVPSAISCDEETSKKKQMEAAIRCALSTFEEFGQLVESESIDMHWPFPPPRDLCLGAGLSIGDGYIGSFSSTELVGLDYTILGTVANDAGKMVERARSDELMNFLAVERSIAFTTRRGVHRVGVYGQWERISDLELDSLIRRLGQPHTSILIASSEFNEVASLPEFESYVIHKDDISELIIFKSTLEFTR